MSTQAKLGNSLLVSLIELRKNKGKILIEDVEGILKNMADSLVAEESPPIAVLKNEILKIADHISQAKIEISALRPEDDVEPEKSKNIEGAFVQLKAIVKATEDATNTILDAADEIDNVISKMGRGTEEEALIKAAASRIYEACHFQDITGQRVNKVIGMLEFIDSRIDSLLALFANTTGDTAKPAKAAPKVEARTSADLLNGPQLPGAAPSQDDIDALFNSLK